jgi:hypothetical protein
VGVEENLPKTGRPKTRLGRTDNKTYLASTSIDIELIRLPKLCAKQNIDLTVN